MNSGTLGFICNKEQIFLILPTLESTNVVF